VSWRNKGKGGSLLTGAAFTALRLMALLALVAAYSRGKRSCTNRERASNTGLASTHLVDTELPLHEGDDPPVVEVRKDQSRTQPSVRQALKREQG
jgi:hypothetical protein